MEDAKEGLHTVVTKNYNNYKVTERLILVQKLHNLFLEVTERPFGYSVEALNPLIIYNLFINLFYPMIEIYS